GAVENRHGHAGHAVEHAAIAARVTQLPHAFYLRAQIHFVEHAIAANTRHIKANDLFSLGLGQERENRETSLPHAECDASANIACERANRKGPFADVETHCVETAFDEQKNRIAEAR